MASSRVGSPVAPDPLATSRSLWQRMDRRDLTRAGVVLGLTLAAAIMGRTPLPGWAVAMLAIVGIVVGCRPIAVEAWRDLRARRMSMDLSMLIAIVAAAAIGQWVTALIITVFVLAAEILEDLCMDQGRDALTDLMSFLPSTVEVRDNQGTHAIPLSEVRVGQIVVVTPGGRVPVDGTVAAGASSVDESRITGESMPREVTPGEGVFAGSINQTGALELRVDRVGEGSSYGQIIQAVRRAQASRAPVQKLADQFAAYLISFALAAAVIALVTTRNLTTAISVVIVAGACGIAAGTPLAVLAAIARAAQAGSFVKDGTHLERLSTVDTIIFDKTGTLTLGAPQVVGLSTAAGVDEDRLLALAAGAEWHSEHPLARAIVAQAQARGLPVSDPEHLDYQPGVGVTATLAGAQVTVGSGRLVPQAPKPSPAGGVTVVHVAEDDVYLGGILLADRVRNSARDCIAGLHGLGLRTLMMTGDHRTVAETIATELGMDDVRADLLPADKHRIIQVERANGHRVAMVGDGVNDAPALAEADVGIAIGSGTDIAQKSSDIVLVGTDLRDLADTVRIARRMRHIVMFNFVGTIAVDLLGMILAALGVLGPLFAAVVHVGSESAFILNSARLIPTRRARGSTRAESDGRTDRGLSGVHAQQPAD